VHGRGYQGGGTSFGPPVTPDIIKQLLIANLAIFVLSMMVPSVFALGAATPVLFWEHGFLWQPLTYMWLHSTHSIWHIAMNCFVLWMFGSPVALVWGAKRFLRFYLLCGVGAGLFIVTMPYLFMASQGAEALRIPTVGASGAVYGVVLAYSLTWPDRQIMLIFPPVAFRAIWIIPVMFFMTLLGDRAGTVSHVAHLGGVVVAWFYLRRQGQGKVLPSLNQLKFRLNRWRMRRRLRAVRREESSGRSRDHDDRTIH
jgi:membrane associated rhomboid family serine protease